MKEDVLMNRVTLATITGLVLGLTVVFANFGYMLVVAVFAPLGYGAAKVLDGDLDLPALVNRNRDR